MILTLIILWVAGSVVFFGSLAIAASRPVPPLNPEDLINGPDWDQTQSEDHALAQPQFAYSAARGIESLSH
jgi:hypothetical protein